MIEPNIVAVDSLQFLVLVDNCLDSLSSVPPHVTLEWPRLMSNGMRKLSGEWQCCANHGLSVLVTAMRDGVSHTILFDAGPENYVLERNSPRLGANHAAVEGMGTGTMPVDYRQRFVSPGQPAAHGRSMCSYTRECSGSER